MFYKIFDNNNNNNTVTTQIKYNFLNKKIPRNVKIKNI